MSVMNASRVLILSLSLLISLPQAATASTPPKVVVSISPLHSLVSAIGSERFSATLLIPPSQSPHGFRLRPSSAQALHQADLIVWVGTPLETTLASSITEMDSGRRVISALQTPGMELLQARGGGVHQHHVKGKHPAHADSDHSDPHLWLDPANASALVTELVQQLSALDPDYSALYQRNGEQLRQRLADLDRELEHDYAALHDRPFMVLHDSFQYLERRYHLNGVGSISVSPDRRPSARRLVALRRLIRESDALCLFAEPQASAKVLDSLTSESHTRLGTLDPIGAKLEPGPDAYFQMQRDNARALIQCLTP